MNINIEPEDIDLYVKNAIMESTLGKNIKEGIESSLKDLFSGYKNPIESIMKKELEKLVGEYLEKEEVKPRIMEAIAKVVTPDAVASIITYGVAELQRKYRDAY